MLEQPSWRSSTLSQLAVGAVTFFALSAWLVSVGGIWKAIQIETAKELMTWPTILLSTFGSSYLVARKTNGNPPGGGDAKPDH